MCTFGGGVFGWGWGRSEGFRVGEIAVAVT